MATLYYVIYPSAQSAPSAAQVKAGQNSGGTAATASGTADARTTTGEQVFAAATGLTASTSYRAAFVWTNGTSDSNVAVSDAFTTLSDTVNLSATQQVGAFTQTAEVAGGEWSAVDEWASAINSTPWGNYTHRLRIAASLVPDVATTKIRITYGAAPGGAGASTTAVYVGVAAATGDAYDFDGAPTEVTFGGASGFSLSAGATILSDEISLVLDGTRDILIAGQTASGQPGDFAGFDGRAGWKAWYKSGADAATQDATGYSANLVEAVGAVKVEVYALPSLDAALSAAQSVGAFSQAATVAADAALQATQAVGAFDQVVALAADASAGAAQSVGAFGQVASLSVADVAGLGAAQSVGSFGQSASLASDAALSAAQSVGAFSQAATVAADAALQATQAVGAFDQVVALAADASAGAAQSVGAFGQVASLSVADVAGLGAAQSVGSFGQSASLASDAALNAVQQVGSFGQSAFLALEDTVTLLAAQAVGAFVQSAALTVDLTLQASQPAGSFGQSAQAIVLPVAGVAAVQAVGAFGQSAQVDAGETPVALDAAQPIGGFVQQAAVQALVAAAASQAIGAFGQDARVITVTVNTSADHQVGEFGQDANIGAIPFVMGRLAGRAAVRAALGGAPRAAPALQGNRGIR